MTLSKGEDSPLPAAVVTVEFGRAAGEGTPRTDACALLLTGAAAGAGAGARDIAAGGEGGEAVGAGAEEPGAAAGLVHAAAPRHATGAARYEGTAVRGGFAVDTITLDLASLPAATASVVVLVRGDGGALCEVPDMRIAVTDQEGVEVARYDCGQAGEETAYVLGECRRGGGGWRFRAVGQGYAGGLGQLAAAYGLRPEDLPELPAAPEVREEHAAAAVKGAGPVQAGAPVQVAALVGGPGAAATALAASPAPSSPGSSTPAPAKVTLTDRASAVSLARQGGDSGELRVSLDWSVRPGLPGAGAVELDLCALFELSDGSKGVVQPLGGAFGSLRQPPFILLDGGDRTGDGDDRADHGSERITLNLDHAAHFRRVLLFVTIYSGVRNFAGLDTMVTLRPQRGADIGFALGECTVDSSVCALALLGREGPDLVVRREARYLVPRRGVSPQRTVDYAYGWGLAWTPGRK